MEDRPRFQTGPREIRPSGIIGGPRETWPGWNCAPTSHTERARMVTLHLYTGAPSSIPTTHVRTWEAGNITQKYAGLTAFWRFSERLNWKIMENGKWLSSSMTAAMLPSLIVHADGNQRY